MAILLLVSTPQENVPHNNIDDVVGVFDDKHPFSEHELERFAFLTVTGSREDVQARLNQMRPAIAQAYYLVNTGKYSFDRGADNDGRIEVWSTLEPPYRWYELVNNDKFIFQCADFTQAEKDFVADAGFDINLGTADNYIKKFVKDLGRKPENTTEITELRRETP